MLHVSGIICINLIWFFLLNYIFFGSKINTAIMKKQLGCIQVQVPPDIVDERSTSDVTVNEGDNVTLTCTATGKPTPRIVWRREDGQKIVVIRPTATGSPSAFNHHNLHGTKTSSSSSATTNATTISVDLEAATASTSHHQHHQHQGIPATTTRERSKGKLSIPLATFDSHQFPSKCLTNRSRNFIGCWLKVNVVWFNSTTGVQKKRNIFLHFNFSASLSVKLSPCLWISKYTQ